MNEEAVNITPTGAAARARQALANAQAAHTRATHAHAWAAARHKEAAAELDRAALMLGDHHRAQPAVAHREAADHGREAAARADQADGRSRAEPWRHLVSTSDPELTEEPTSATTSCSSRRSLPRR